MLLDIDECSDGSHGCDVNANCTNTYGSWVDYFFPYSVIICKCIVFRDIEDCNGYGHVYMIQFDHVNAKPLRKETCRSTFVYVVQTLSD